MQDINLQIKSGQLIGVLGRVGSGKSTLLQALAGELGPIEGECLVRANSLAYLPQLPWILNKTLRDNVLFDQEENVDYEFYGQTLSACALSEDLKLLPASDLTEIGEKVCFASLIKYYTIIGLGYKSLGRTKSTSSNGKIGVSTS